MDVQHDGFKVVQSRDGDIPAVAAVHLATRRHAYAGLLPASVLERMSVDSLRRWWASRLRSAPHPHAMLVGITDPQRRDVAGFVHAGPGQEVGVGEIYAIHVHPNNQGRGYGRRLLTAAMRELAEYGHKRGRLWVLEGNLPAQGFYRRLGWVPVEGARRIDEIEGAAVSELAFDCDLRPAAGS
ncbi:GNAT family N-acetyltransferase [Micromonospora parva]|uniref:GNAT family N-acetyltransferase n=1 Tax=Micromonospora parva TaxID=1464048 RepID=UPI00340CB177